MNVEHRLTTPSGLDAYSPDRPLVLVTEYGPDATGGGGVILRGLLSPAERSKVVWLTLTPFAPKTAEGWAGMTLLSRSSAGRRPGASRSLWRDATVDRRAIAAEVLEVSTRRGVRALWIMMHGACVPVASLLTRSRSLPVHLTVHDDPLGQALVSRKYLALAPWLARTFGDALRRADSVDTIGPAMAERYKARLGVDSSVVHRGVAGPVEPSPPHDRRRGIGMGLIGSIYDYSMIFALGRAVALASQELGVPGRVLVVGRGVGERLRADLGGRIDVEVTGHLDEAEAVRRLQECFLLYVNYPFGRRAGVFRQTSFPTKLSTYAQAARPLLVHMPPDGSVVALTRTPGGYASHWPTPHASDGAELMVRLWNDPASHLSVHEAAESVRSRYYDLATNRATLFGLLNGLATAGS